MFLHCLRGREVCFCHLLEISTWQRQISHDTKEKVCASIYISATCRCTGVERSRTQHVKLQETRGKLNSMFCSEEAGAAATPFFSIGAETRCFPSVNPLLYYSFILKHIILDPKQISTDFKVDSSYQCGAILFFSLHQANIHTRLEQGESLGIKPGNQTGLENGRVSSLLSSITKGRNVRFNSYFVGMHCVFSLLAELMLIYLAVQLDY